MNATELRVDHTRGPVRYHWQVTNTRTKAVGFYHAANSKPVDADHVSKSPSVKRWANGDPIEVTEPGPDMTGPALRRFDDGSGIGVVTNQHATS